MTIALHEVTLADAQLIFEWRNLPYIVALGSKNKAVSWEEHNNWVSNSIDSAFRKVFIILIDEQPAGQVRFDKDDETNAVISVYLLEEFSGKGAGVKSIQMGCEMISHYWPTLKTVQADVLKSNEIGNKAFIKAGFLPNLSVADDKHDQLVFKI